MDFVNSFRLVWISFILLLLLFFMPLFFFLRRCYRVARAFYRSIIDLSQLSSIEDLDNLVLDEEIHQWAINHNFSNIRTFYFKTRGSHTFISKWIDPGKNTVLSFLVNRIVLTKYSIYENRISTCLFFSTVYEPGIFLRTHNLEWATFHPDQSIKYEEFFPKIPVEVLFRQHCASRQYLIETGGEKLIAMDPSTSEQFLKSQTEYAQFIRGIPLWPVRFVFWYFFLKYHGQNLSIQEQHQKGKIKLPNELNRA